MIRFTCNGDWLVEYADGELAVADCARAESHLAACPGCSREVAALRSSREMLSVYFVTADSVSPVTALRNRTDSQTGWNVAALALASMAATALLISLFIFLRQGERDIVRAVSPPTEVPIASTAAEQPEEDDVLAMISRETQIARLRMASEILAKEPGMTERHLALDRYLTQTYGVTTKRQPSEM